MSYLDRLQTAQFRGLTFLTDDHEAAGGRRLVVHSYPNSDDQQVEDFGLKANNWRLNAYFIGPDYDIAANDFMSKLAISGATWLMHPWLGNLWVRAQDWSRSESNDKNAYCTISITFVPGGQAPAAPTVDKIDVAFDKTQKYMATVVDAAELKPMSTNELTAFIAQANQHLEHVRKAIALTRMPLTWINAGLGLIAGVKNDINVLLQVPGDYANALASVFNAVGLSNNSASEIISDAARLSSVTRLTDLAVNPPSIIRSNLISTTFSQNSAIDNNLRAAAAIVAAAYIAIANYEDADAQKAVLVKLVSAVDFIYPNAPDSTIEALQDMYAALIDLLSVASVSQLRQFVNPIPAVVVAYDSGLNEDSLIAKNKVRHPLFLQGDVYV